MIGLVHWLKEIFMVLSVSETSDDRYTLTIIEDEPVALAGGPAQDPGLSVYYIGTVVVVMLVALVLGTALYLMECHKYQMRLLSICKDITHPGNIPNRWSLSKLKDQVREEEAIAADRLVEDLTFDEK